MSVAPLLLSSPTLVTRSLVSPSCSAHPRSYKLHTASARLSAPPLPIASRSRRSLAMSFSTDDEEVDEFEDEPDYTTDWGAATIDYLAATMPPRAAAPPVASTSSSRPADKGKGKGKEGDVAEEEASQEQDSPERTRNKEELTKLAAVSPTYREQSTVYELGAAG